jgi:hypothetical protein
MTPTNETLEKQVERLRLRIDNLDGLYRELRQMCNGLFAISEGHRGWLEQITKLIGPDGYFFQIQLDVNREEAAG